MFKYIAVLLILVGSAMAQSSVIPYPGIPSGTCAPTKLGLDLANGHLYACNNGTWLEIGPGAAGAAAWNTITSGTNAGQTLTVGNGTTMATTGTGVINANQLGGKTFAVPAAIGSTTPAAGTFTALTANTSFVLNGSGTLTSVVGNGTKLQSTAITAPAAAKCVEVDTSGVLQIAASNAACGSGASGVTSVALAGPTGFQISGSPVTTTGTLTLAMPASWATGDLLLGNGANSVARLAIGSNATCLTSNGTTASWGSCSSGSGTVTVVGAGSLTSTAFVTGGGTTTLQTPSATSTLDASGNASFAGTVSAGGTGGVVPLVAGIGSLGATSLPFQYVYITGGSGTPASEYAILSGSFTGVRTINFPDSNSYVPAASNLITLAGPTGGNKTITFPDANITVARSDAANTFTGTQTFGAVVGTTWNGNTWATGTGTLSIAAGKTATFSNTLTFTGTDSSSVAFGAGGTVLYSGARRWSCQPGIGDGTNAVTAATYLESICYNDTGSTVTITGVKCFTDNSGSSTLNVAGNTLGALLTGAVTCTSSFAAGTQSANVALTSGDYLKFTWVLDGTSKQLTSVVTGTY